MLKPKQKKCIEMLVSGHFTKTEIANELNIARKTINYWENNDDEFKKQFENTMRISIKSLAPKAIKTMANLLNSDSDNVRFSAAKDILDRTGFKPQEKIEISKPIDDSIKEMEEYLCKRKKEDT